jgi:hypothetical protein
MGIGGMWEIGGGGLRRREEGEYEEGERKKTGKGEECIISMLC